MLKILFVLTIILVLSGVLIFLLPLFDFQTSEIEGNVVIKSNFVPYASR